MIIQPLDTIDFKVLMTCFSEAFENYYVQMPTDPEYYKKRWEVAKVRLELSFGMFDENVLVGFIIHAIDQREGTFIAFNTGTGVIPSYRGKRIIHALYTHATPILKTHDITLCRLEVIKENAIAVKIYERIGFAITKNYKCYKGILNLANEVDSFELKKVTASFFDWDTLHQSYYSWDNHIHTVKHDTYDYYAVFTKKILIGYFIIKPDTGYIAQFDIYHKEEEHWYLLFNAIQAVSNTIKINNIDESLIGKVNFLNQIRIENTVDQYEMEFHI